MSVLTNPVINSLRTLFILLVFFGPKTILSRNEDRYMTSAEGGIAWLDFNFPGNVTHFNLSIGDRQPFNRDGQPLRGGFGQSQWERFGAEVKRTQTSSSVRLTVNGVHREDAGTYTCNAIIGGIGAATSERVTQRIGFYVSFPPGKPVCHFLPDDVDNADEDRLLTLECVATVGSDESYIICLQEEKFASESDPQLDNDTHVVARFRIDRAKAVGCCSNVNRHRPPKPCDDFSRFMSTDRTTTDHKETTMDASHSRTAGQTNNSRTADQTNLSRTAEPARFSSHGSRIWGPILAIISSCIVIVVLVLIRGRYACYRRNSSSQDQDSAYSL